MDTVRIFDTTLRDGEQSPGATLTLPGEAGDRPPARSDGRRHHRGRVSRSAPTATSNRSAPSPREITQARSSAAWPAARPRTSSAPAKRSSTPPSRPHPRLLRHIEDPPRAQAAQGEGRDHQASAVESIKQALRVHERHRVLARRTPAARSWSSWRRSSQAAVEAGATTINLPDTVGYATPKALRRDLLAPARRSCRS